VDTNPSFQLQKRSQFFIRPHNETLSVAKFLRDGQGLVAQQPATTAWFGIRLGPTTFAIFDAFADDAGRDAHLSGKVAKALMEKAPELLAEPPKIEKADVLADRLPG
jgi:hypothetical protein